MRMREPLRVASETSEAYLYQHSSETWSIIPRREITGDGKPCVEGNFRTQRLFISLCVVYLKILSTPETLYRGIIGWQWRRQSLNFSRVSQHLTNQKVHYLVHKARHSLLFWARQICFSSYCSVYSRCYATVMSDPFLGNGLVKTLPWQRLHMQRRKRCIVYAVRAEEKTGATISVKLCKEGCEGKTKELVQSGRHLGTQSVKLSSAREPEKRWRCN